MRIVEGVPLASVADARANGRAFEHLENQRPACHSDTGELLLGSAEPLADCLAFSPSFRALQYVALITRATIFAVGFGQRGVAYRLPTGLAAAALEAGARPCEWLGAGWFEFELFRRGGAPDLGLWTLRAYSAARGEAV